MRKTESWYAQTEPSIRRRMEEGYTDAEIVTEMRALGAVAPWEVRYAAAYVAEVRVEAERPAQGWRDADRWTRGDFLARIHQDQKEGRSGSKASIAGRALMSPTALWRRWEKVRKPRERWPSGNKGPADRI